jgi:hypothetical protein
MNTKLGLQAMVDRAAMTPNEWRSVLNLAPLPGGDAPIRRLDTAVVNLAKALTEKIDGSNCKDVTAVILRLLGGGEKS